MTVTILVGSIGRRNYLIDWFREALTKEGVRGRLITTDANPDSAGATAADAYIRPPLFTTDEYVPFMAELIDDLQPDLFFSLNDYEISIISLALAEKQISRPRMHFFPEWASQQVLEDKFRMYQTLQGVGVPTPRTVLGSSIDRQFETYNHRHDFMVKHRYGSGSSGVRRVEAHSLIDAVKEASVSAPRPLLRPHLTHSHATTSRVVVQPYLEGIEYGLDGVYSATNAGTLNGVLARRKIGMRCGETDKAVTVDSALHMSPLAKIGRHFGLRGPVDMDVLELADGQHAILDINPRFGGGYPFMHIAGADVPRHYLRALLTGDESSDLLNYATQVTGAKYENVRRTN